MAIYKLYKNFDLSSAAGQLVYLSSYNSNHIQLSNTGYVENYYGNGFTYNDYGVTGGTVTSLNGFLYGGLALDIGDLSHSAVEIAGYVFSMNPVGLWKYVFSGNDELYGTVNDDFLNAEAGNDKLFGFGGNNRLDGGEGIDTAVYLGARSHYTVAVDNFGHTVGTASQFSARTTDTLLNMERLKFTDTNVALDIAGNGGQAYRIYQAALDRKPDAEGLGYWIRELDSGKSLTDVADSFLHSAEFGEIFGRDLSANEFVTTLYNNILHRAPEQGGFDYWVNQVQTGATSEAGVLASFSESAENQAAVIGQIQGGFEYAEWAS